MKRLLYSELATDDLKGILDYIARDKPMAARAFVDGIIETCRLISKNPELGMRREDLAPSPAIIHASRLRHLLSQSRC